MRGRCRLPDLGKLTGGVGAVMRHPADRDHHAVVNRPAGGGVLRHQRGMRTRIDERNVAALGEPGRRDVMRASRARAVVEDVVVIRAAVGGGHCTGYVVTNA